MALVSAPVSGGRGREGGREGGKKGGREEGKEGDS